jgi:hypothetical protein
MVIYLSEDKTEFIEAVAVRSAYSPGFSRVYFQAKTSDGEWVDFLKKHNRHFKTKITEPMYFKRYGAEIAS